MHRLVGPGQIANLVRLSGGANMESSSFDFAGAGYVLRRAPSAEMMAGRPFGHDVEAALVRTARDSGVLAPEVVGVVEPQDALGTGYIMRRVEAEVNPAKILASPPSSLIGDIARELARVHAVPVVKVPDIPFMDTAIALAELKARFMQYGGDRPIIALAIRWCEDNLPEPAMPVLVHGDFRMGNLMVDDNGLAAILDWELAHIGDAHEDLAWGCVAAWCFGHNDKPAFGCADFDSYFAAYKAESGTKVDPVRFRFWLIYRTLWWAIGCLQMGEIWRSGVDRTLERAIIARRTSENEIDLLLLLEEDAPECDDRSVEYEAGDGITRKGEPSATELLDAVSEWIAADIKPKTEGRDKFLVAVAMNALGIVRRELAKPVLVQNKELADDILVGRKSLATPGLLETLRINALAKLSNDMPKYPSLAKARDKWTRET